MGQYVHAPGFFWFLVAAAWSHSAGLHLQGKKSCHGFSDTNLPRMHPLLPTLLCLCFFPIGAIFLLIPICVTKNSVACEILFSPVCSMCTWMVIPINGVHDLFITSADTCLSCGCFHLTPGICCTWLGAHLARERGDLTYGSRICDPTYSWLEHRHGLYLLSGRDICVPEWIRMVIFIRVIVLCCGGGDNDRGWLLRDGTLAIPEFKVLI